jgi:hypothetical protein
MARRCRAVPVPNPGVGRFPFSRQETTACARELMLVAGVIFIWDLKGKPLTETGVSQVIGMPRATLTRRIDLLIKEGWV